MNVKKSTELAMLTGIALIIFVIELQIPYPFPLPGIKMGLANIITVYALYHYRVGEVAMLVFSRIVLGAIFSGNMMALAYSFAGSIFCLVGMILLKSTIDERHIWIGSVFGAVLHNIGQICMALVVTQSRGVLTYLPFLIVSGCLAGTFTGVCAQMVLYRFQRINYSF